MKQSETLTRAMTLQWQETRDSLNDYVDQAVDFRDRTRPGSADWDRAQQSVLNMQRQRDRAWAAWQSHRYHPVILKMARVVLDRMEHYQSDFYAYDIPALAEHPDWVFYWGVRVTGTLLVPKFNPTTEQRVLLDYALSENHIFFEVSLEGGLRSIPAPVKKP